MPSQFIHKSLLPAFAPVTTGEACARNLLALSSGADPGYVSTSGSLQLPNLSRDCLLSGEPFHAGCAEETGDRVRLIEHALYIVRFRNRASMAEHDHIRTDRLRRIANR